MLGNAILIVSWARSRPWTFSSFHKFIVNSWNTVTELLKSSRNWRVIISWTWLSAHLERASGNPMSLQLSVYVRLATGREFWAFDSFGWDRITTRSRCGFIVVLKTGFFSTGPTGALMLLRVGVRLNRSIVVRSRDMIEPVVIDELGFASLFAQWVGRW